MKGIVIFFSIVYLQINTHSSHQHFLVPLYTTMLLSHIKNSLLLLRKIHLECLEIIFCECRVISHNFPPIPVHCEANEGSNFTPVCQRGGGEGITHQHLHQRITITYTNIPGESYSTNYTGIRRVIL